MAPVRYVWLVWSCLLMVPWAGFYWAFPRHRAMMGWSSLFCLPFGFCELFFFGRYWNPPTLADLGGRFHLDLESFIFCFAIGGTGSILYHVVTHRPSPSPPAPPRPPRPFSLVFPILTLLTPAVVFAIFLFLSNRPIGAGIAAFVAGTVARLIVYPTLSSKTLAGGLLFLAYYALFLLILAGLCPGYMQRYWQHSQLIAIGAIHLPRNELLFAWSFGMFWSGLYEQAHWIWKIGGWGGRGIGVACNSLKRDFTFQGDCHDDTR